MTSLVDRQCVPCRGGVPPLTEEQRAPLLTQVPGWKVMEGHHLARTYLFTDFVGALAFVNRVGALAEEQGHHPDLHLAWGRVTVEIWTHKIDGLTESDFIFAAKTEGLAATAPGIRE